MPSIGRQAASGGNWWDVDPDDEAVNHGENWWDQYPDSDWGEDRDRQGLTNLPEPRPNMFADMDDEDAQVLYDSYSRHPNAERTENGDLFYNGKPVPKPEGNSPLVEGVTNIGGALINPIGNAYKASKGEGIISDLSKGVVGGVVNAPRQIAQSLIEGSQYVNELGDYILPPTDKVKEIRTKAYDKLHNAVQDNFPAYNPEGAWQGAGEVGGRVATGAVIGNKLAGDVKLAQTANKALQIVPKLARHVADWVVRAAGTSAGTAMTEPGGSAFGWFDIADGQDPSTTRANAEARANIFLENFVMAAPAEVLASGLKGLGKALWSSFVKPIYGAMDETTKASMIMDSVMGHVALAAGARTPEEAAMYQGKILKILQDPENRKIVYDLGKSSKPWAGEVEVPLDVASVIERGLADDPSEAAAKLKMYFQQKRKNIVESNSEHKQTTAAVERPIVALDRHLQDSQETFGGETGVDLAGKGMQQSGIDEMSAAFDKPLETETNIALKKMQTPEVVRKDGSFGQRLSNIEQQSGSDSLVERNTVSKEIAEKTDAGTAMVRKIKNELWNSIPEGLPFDRKSFDDVISKIGPTIGPDIMEQVSKVGDFKSLQNLRKTINDRLNKLGPSSASTLEGQSLTALRDNITGHQVSWLKDAVSNGGIKLSEGNRTYNEKVYQWLQSLGKSEDELSFPDDATEELFKKGDNALTQATRYQREHWGAVNQGAPKAIEDSRFKNGYDKAKRDSETGGIINKAIKDDDPSIPNHFIETLSRPEYGKSHGLVVDYALADATERLRSKIKTSGLGEIDVKEVIDSLRPYRQALNNPRFKDQAKRLDDFENNLLAHQNDIKALEASLPTEIKTAQETAKKIREEKLEEFFTASGDLVDGSYTSFKKAWNSDNGLAKAREHLARAEASNDPDILEGLKATYFKYLHDGVFTPTPGSTGSRALSATKASQFTKGENNVLKIGREIFRGKDEVFMDAIEGLMDPSLEATISKKIGGLKGDDGGFARKATKASNRLVMAMVGPLTRVGARASVLTGVVLDKLDPDGAAARITDAIFSDPDEFLNVAKKWQQGGWKDGRSIRDLFGFLVKTGIYNDGDYDEWQKDIQRMNTENQTEDMLK